MSLKKIEIKKKYLSIKVIYRILLNQLKSDLIKILLNILIYKRNVII